jgi:SecD/SecF fusion protein
LGRGEFLKIESAMLHFPRWKSVLIWFVVPFGVLVASLNLLGERPLSALPAWLQHHRLTLGLDLRGGSYVMLKIERGDVVGERLEAIVSEIGARLRGASIRYARLSGTGQTITVTIADPGQVDAAIAVLKPITDPVSAGLLGSVEEATLVKGDNGQLTINVTDSGINHRVSRALIQAIEVVRRRVEEMSGAEPLIQRQGSDRIVVQVPGVTDPQRLKRFLNQPGKLTFLLIDENQPVEDAISGQPPAGSKVLYSEDDPPVAYLVETRALVSSSNLVDFQPGSDPQTNEPIVKFRVDSDGAQAFEKAARQNAGRPIAIVLDDDVIAVIREPVAGGSGQISGNFSAEGATDLAALLRAGALPATFTVVEERSVGPSLGGDSIRSGIIAGLGGAIAVVCCMLFFYGFLGFIASVALFFNVIMILAALGLIGFTLTLPGIAGIALTMGMAVDSNVLIYERIREEAKSGRPFGEVCKSGFSNALSTVVNANVTTLIAAVILFYLGSGPARGFAVTLGIGSLTTVLLSFTVTRWAVFRWIKLAKVKAIPRGVRTAMFDGANIRFMGIRRYTFTVSAILALGALMALFTVGLHLGADFTGGSVIEVKSKHASANLADIRERLGELNLGEIKVQRFGDSASALIRLHSQGGENAEQSAIVLVRGELEQDYDFRRVEVVGPSVSGELTFRATLGVLAALAAVLIYIWLRYRWQFAVGAVIATLHDIILTLGLFVLGGIEFNLTSIAAVLTIIGYSLNDTVVVYDCVYANLRRYKNMPLPILIDASINQTLSRTVLTSVTTMLALAALCLFGGEVIRSFTFAMLFGVAVGTFSSIYIAAPVLIIFKLRPKAIPSQGGRNRHDSGVEKQSGRRAV